MRILIINGPNLNLLGKREPSIYGDLSFDQYLEELNKEFNERIDYFQSNVEGELINKIHEFGFSNVGIILNAGGYSHTSVAISDAIAAIESPVVEVHISNILAREEFRHKSFVSQHAKGIISGFGLRSYDLALAYFSGK